MHIRVYIWNISSLTPDIRYLFVRPVLAVLHLKFFQNDAFTSSVKSLRFSASQIPDAHLYVYFIYFCKLCEPIACNTDQEPLGFNSSAFVNIQ